MTITFDAYHGTDLEAARRIINENFLFVKSDEKYLGDGVYFFKDGIGNPQEDAKNFALMNAHDKASGKNRYDIYAVIKSLISADDDRILDLNSEEGLKLFDTVRRKVFEKRRLAGEKMSNKVDDGKIINLIVKKNVFPVDIVVSQRSICFNRQLNLHSHVPNCVICCVKNIKCITSSTIVDQGDVA